ncbi:C40 family peptidase [Bifidobacterium choloepi]|uniref:NlpC/P60 family protein n=1 Tax=Bifidobacterium choloepi TaxID=2614131 RepID=A0A6I5N0C7_9BIFI|nr:C40 family peptidase [Bifidobacterium choloepi]NEG69575.1 NlpC/P60 family protein [Bifidobacterium choloepi]
MKTKKTTKRTLTAIAATAAAATLLCCGAATAMADDSASDSSGSTTAVVAERSFPKTTDVKANWLAESTSTDVDEDSNWGGVESLDVPHTQSTAEKEAEAAAKAAAEAAAQAEAEEQAAAASRSQSRTDVSDTSTSTSNSTSTSTSTSTTTTTTTSTGSATGASIAALAQQYVGAPYVSGGASPSGWDCSGLVMWVYAQFGISLPHSAAAQSTLGTAVSSLAEAQPGDIIANSSHAGIYIGNGLVVNALNPSQGTQINAVGSVSSFAGGYSIRRLV